MVISLRGMFALNSGRSMNQSWPDQLGVPAEGRWGNGAETAVRRRLQGGGRVMASQKARAARALEQRSGGARELNRDPKFIPRAV